MFVYFWLSARAHSLMGQPNSSTANTRWMDIYKRLSVPSQRSLRCLTLTIVYLLPRTAERWADLIGCTLANLSAAVVLGHTQYLFISTCRQKEKEQMEALRKHHSEEIEHHKKEIERLQKEIDRHKGKIRKLKHDD